MLLLFKVVNPDLDAVAAGDAKAPRISHAGASKAGKYGRVAKEDSTIT